MGIRRESRADPLRVALVDSFPQAVRQLPARGDLLADTLRIGLAQCARVAVGPDGHDRVDVVDLEAVDVGDERQLLLRGLSDCDDVDPFDRDPGARVRAGTQRLPVELAHERRRDGPAVEPDDLPGPELERIVHQQIGQLRHARIGHVGSYIASGGSSRPAEWDMS